MARLHCRYSGVLAMGFFALLACTCARADAPLSLAELSDFALRNNPATRAAWFNATVDMAGTDAARALLQPNLSLNVPLTFDRGQASGGAASGSSDVTRTLAPSLGLTWVLFDFGARASGVEAARWQAAASQLGYNRALQSVVNLVEQAYYGLLGARQLQAALQLGVTATRASLDVAQARRSAGLATVGETALAEAAWAQATLQLVRAQSATRSADGSLASALGLPVNTPLNVADDDLRPLPANTPEGSRIDALLATARTSRADLLALNAAVQQGQAQLAAAQVQGWPQLALSAQAGRRWVSDGNNGNTQQLALTLTMPLFDGGLIRAQTQAARARVDLLTAQRDQQSQVVDLDVWQSFQNADSADAVIDSAQALLRSATQAEDAARERYRVGVGSLLELIVAQSTAAQARVSAVQARYDARLAVARLGYAVGARTAATAPIAPN
jgi:outer membrane protein TolC